MSRRQILTADEHARLFGMPSDPETLIRHCTLSPADLDWLAGRRGAANRLGAAVQLCLLRHPGFGLRVEENPPESLLACLARQLDVPAAAWADYARRDQTRREHARALALRLGLRTFTRADLPFALSLAGAAAWGEDRGEPIVSAIMAGLREARIIPSSPRMIERLGLAGRARARKRAAATLVDNLTPGQLERIDALLTNDPQLRSSRLAWLRAIPEAVAASSLVAVLARLDHVRAIGLDPALATTIHERRFRQLVREGAVAPAYMIDRFSRLRRRATLAAQILELQARLTDAVIDLFDKLVGTLFAKGKRGRQRRYQAAAGDVGRLMGLFGGTISALQAARERDTDPFELLDETVGWWRLLQAKPQVDAFAELARTDPLSAASEKYATLRRFAPAFIDRMELRAGAGGKSLLAAIALLRELNRTGRRDVPADAPMPFTSRAWKRLVRQGGEAGGKIDRRLYETAVVATLRDRLRAGDVWVNSSRAWRRFDAYLLPEVDVAAHAAGLPVERDVDRYLARRGEELEQRLERFAGLLGGGRLEGVCLEGGRLHVASVAAATPEAAKAIDRTLDALLPRVRITELLREVDGHTGFASRFRDLRTGRAHDRPSVILAAVLADATNLGLERMANASPGITYAQLAWAHTWFLSEETYKAALATIIAAHHAHPFARHWGDGTASSSDGQFFRSGRRAQGAGAVNAKYGPEPGLRVYTHLSDRYGSFHAKVISATASEAPHVLDGLVTTGTDPDGHAHYTDTGGATDHVFALCHLLGYRFVPRIRDLRDRRLGTLARTSRLPALAPILGRPIRTDVIRESWDDLIRLAASIQAGTTLPSAMLKKLAAYKRQNRLDLALGELGRLERTFFTLDWLESPELRRRCHAGLNKSEARHALAQAVFAHKQGRIADRTLESQEHRTSGLNLVIAAIGYWNTIYLDRVVDRLRGRGEGVPEHLLPHVSPLGWGHVALTGDYLWDSAASDPLGFRPLNEPSGYLGAAA
jgi:TnpA family transposase